MRKSLANQDRRVKGKVSLNMPILLQLGSNGADVGRLEVRLAELGLFTGVADNVYGGGVESAVKAFQKSRGLAADGVVGPRTWAALFPGVESAPNPLVNAPLIERCLALIGTFETSSGMPDCFAGLSGDFDGQGISFGAAQWNIGQGTLQPLLADMLALHEDVMSGLFHERLDELRAMLTLPLAGQLSWARGIQDPVRKNIFEPWRGLFHALGRTPEFQAIQVRHAASIHAAARQFCDRFGVTTEKGRRADVRYSRAELFHQRCHGKKNPGRLRCNSFRPAARYRGGQTAVCRQPPGGSSQPALR